MSAGLFQVIVGVTLLYVNPLFRVAPGAPPLSVTVTLTAPAACAGVVALRCVLSIRVPVTLVLPKVTVNGSWPLVNPVPVIVTDVPPVVGPDDGETLVIEGASLNAV